jgi:hypothetical protein
MTLEYLFTPPLERPYLEHSNKSKTNRRDLIMPNYATDGFWAFMRTQYRAEFIVVDAKNLSGDAGKEHVLQVANYLSLGGAGLFGLIATRNGLSRSGQYIQREQWILHSKMILVLTHDDVDQMFEALADANKDPATLIRQKLEDFRLSV